MKHIAPKIVLVAAFVALSVSASFAQATASASASATIITPIAISKTADMNFGNAAVGASAGTIVLAPAGTRTKTGGVTLVTGGTVTAASFSVTGLGTSTYSITLPSSCTISDGAAHTMTVDNFVSTPAAAGGGTLTAGAQTLTVGATLNVDASQVAGTYTSGTAFDVTVNYN